MELRRTAGSKGYVDLHRAAVTASVIRKNAEEGAAAESSATGEIE
jgi:hypothetical protein